MAKQSTCHTCVYAHWDRAAWLRSLGSGWPARPTCGNQPDSYGRLRECPCGTVCRNYRARPPVPQGEGVKTIPLTGGFYAYVDAADYEWLNQWRWRACDRYAVRYEGGKRIYMHREIMQPAPGKVVDHVNGNGYDNTRASLRNITRQQNSQNMGKYIGTASIYKGVSYDKESHRWRARINLGKERFELGQFDSEAEAARAYDRGAVAVFGEFARVNFPEEWPPEKVREVHAKWLREQARQKRKASAGSSNAKARTKAPARAGRKRATRNAKRVTKRAPRKTSLRVPQ